MGTASMSADSVGAGWPGAAVVCVLVAALATVAAIAGRRLFVALRGGLGASSSASGAAWARPAVHLTMALGMALMAVPRGTIVPDSVVRDGFGALGVVLAVGSFALARGRHGLHHAAMCGVMVLMAAPARGGAATVAMASGMVMPSPSRGGGGPSALMLAAFGYACALTLAFAWRMPRRTPDPLGHACEVTMLTSTVVMLLPML
jgi:hypothetical protein